MHTRQEILWSEMSKARLTELHRDCVHARMFYDALNLIGDEFPERLIREVHFTSYLCSMDALN